MSTSVHGPSDAATEREALRRRIKQMYAGFNHAQWEKCFALVDPKLKAGARVEFPSYAGSLRAFKETYGAIHPWYTRISLHLDASTNKHDDRPFAYVYVVWQDEARAFHMFKERWVKDEGRWFTRVVGLVPDRRKSGPAQD